MTRTRGVSPKIIGPFVTALSAFITAKVHDDATAALLVAAVGTAAAILLPPGEITTDPREPRRIARAVRRAGPRAQRRNSTTKKET